LRHDSILRGSFPFGGTGCRGYSNKHTSVFRKPPRSAGGLGSLRSSEQRFSGSQEPCHWCVRNAG
jgi:hypothetical protein